MSNWYVPLPKNFIPNFSRIKISHSWLILLETRWRKFIFRRHRQRNIYCRENQLWLSSNALLSVTLLCYPEIVHFSTLLFRLWNQKFVINWSMEEWTELNMIDAGSTWHCYQRHYEFSLIYTQSHYFAEKFQDIIDKCFCFKDRDRSQLSFKRIFHTFHFSCENVKFTVVGPTKWNTHPQGTFGTPGIYTCIWANCKFIVPFYSWT